LQRIHFKSFASSVLTIYDTGFVLLPVSILIFCTGHFLLIFIWKQNTFYLLCSPLRHNDSIVHTVCVCVCVCVWIICINSTKLNHILYSRSFMCVQSQVRLYRSSWPHLPLPVSGNSFYEEARNTFFWSWLGKPTSSTPFWTRNFLKCVAWVWDVSHLYIYTYIYTIHSSFFFVVFSMLSPGALNNLI